MLIDAYQRGDVTAALALYEPDGILVVESGKVARCPEALREAIVGFAALKPTLTTESYEVFEVGGISLYASRWRLRGTAPDGSVVQQEGESTDILRRAPDGTWLIAIDNPWDSAVLR
jgi:ketosteroid isomerase-like protein